MPKRTGMVEKRRLRTYRNISYKAAPNPFGSLTKDRAALIHRPPLFAKRRVLIPTGVARVAKEHLLKGPKGMFAPCRRATPKGRGTLQRAPP